jgi:hypothetical protein
VFSTLHSYCRCPWLSINLFSVKGNQLVFLPTMTETWCTCRFRPCRNAAKPQRPCRTVALGSQHRTTQKNVLTEFDNVTSIIT